jgi:hypothetical protein
MTGTDDPVWSSRTLVYQSGGLFTQWVAEIDPVTKRLRLSRRWFGRRKTVVDCSLDDCVSVGTVEYNTEGHLAYGTYFKLKNGDWHAIPLEGNSFEEALSVVKQVSAKTGIPILAVKFS